LRGIPVSEVERQNAIEADGARSSFDLSSGIEIVTDGERHLARKVAEFRQHNR